MIVMTVVEAMSAGRCDGVSDGVDSGGGGGGGSGGGGGAIELSLRTIAPVVRTPHRTSICKVPRSGDETNRSPVPPEFLPMKGTYIGSGHN